jgi:hypothetical protein
MHVIFFLLNAEQIPAKTCKYRSETEKHTLLPCSHKCILCHLISNLLEKRYTEYRMHAQTISKYVFISNNYPQTPMKKTQFKLMNLKPQVFCKLTGNTSSCKCHMKYTASSKRQHPTITKSLAIRNYRLVQEFL